jgi:hypothetical protein
MDFTELGPVGTKSRTDLADISPADAKDFEEAITYHLANPGRRTASPAFPSKALAEEWLSLFRSYAYQREAGRVVVAGNAAADGTARFNVTAYVKA